jgi:chemotaxis regulatin CheY-phosphate phosphatase CheZ
VGSANHGFGPVVPRVNDANVVIGQDDIDALLSNLNI